MRGVFRHGGRIVRRRERFLFDGGFRMGLRLELDRLHGLGEAVRNDFFAEAGGAEGADADERRQNNKFGQEDEEVFRGEDRRGTAEVDDEHDALEELRDDEAEGDGHQGAFGRDADVDDENIADDDGDEACAQSDGCHGDGLPFGEGALHEDTFDGGGREDEAVADGGDAAERRDLHVRFAALEDQYSQRDADDGERDGGGHEDGEKHFAAVADDFA